MSEEFKIKTATINFIYSFLPVKNEISLPRDVLQKIYTMYKNKDGYECDRGIPCNRKGISSYLTLDLEMGFLRFPEFTGQLEGITLSVEPTIRIFPLGSSCCLRVSAQSTRQENVGQDETKPMSLSVDDVHKILHLVGQIGNQAAKHKITNIKSNYCSFENNEAGLFEIFSFFSNKVVLDFKSKYCKDEDNATEELHLLCSEHVEETAEEKQHPWIVSILELEGSAHNAFCGSWPNKAMETKKYQDIIAPILYCSATGVDFVFEPAYIDLVGHSDKIGFRNLNIDARLFVQMSQRSVLCICGDQSENPPAYFIPVLLHLCEISHTRWLTLVVLNHLLDESIRDFADDLTKRALAPEAKLKGVIKLASRLAACLEDPGAYVVSGDALRKIHEGLKDIYRLDDLVMIVLKKLDTCEKLYRHTLELAWSQKF